jgi:hypothetical protein
MRGIISLFLVAGLGWTLSNNTGGVGGGTASPIMFQHIASSTNPTGNGIAGRAFVVATEPLPANSVAVIFVSALVGKTVTISDTLGATWTNLCAASGGSGNAEAWAFVAPLGATGGADKITIGVGASNTQPVQYDLTVWENINTTTPSGGSHCSAVNGVTPAAGVITDTGSFTPTNNNANGGNVIETYVPVCTGFAGGNTSSWTAGSGFTLLNSEIIWTNNQGFPNAVQWKTQTTSASYTPTITESGDTVDCFNMATVALQVANNSQTAPSTIHIAKIIHESMVAPGTTTIATKQEWTGNLRIATFTWTGGCPGGGGSCLTSSSPVTSSDGCVWTLKGVVNGGSGIAYAQNCSTNLTGDTVTLHLTSALASGQFSFRLYDVTGAAAASFQNATTDASAACGTSWSNMPGSFTPTGATAGVVFHAMGNGNGPIVVTSPANETFDLWTFTGITDSDLADNADDSDHTYYSGSIPTLSWSGTKAHGADQCYYMSAAFN